MSEIDADDWFGALVPGKTPMAIRQKLSAEIARALAMPDVRTRLNELGAEPQSSTPEEFDALLANYLHTVRKLGDDMDIKLE
jgi:tripartite-type tricarboxylate transporter receptor subunit TctC